MANKFTPTTVVAIDFGTAATGYCIAQAPSSTGRTAPAPTSARVYPFKPGDRSSSATEKNLTSVLLDAQSLKAISVGREARRRFFEMDQEEMKKYLYLECFKMLMSPTRRGTTPLTSVAVHGLGADKAIPLLTAVAKMLSYVREEAEDRVRSLGVDPNSIGWVLTVPAIWDDEAKMFMRLSAVSAGMIDSIDSDRLQLALEPEGAVIAAMMDSPPDLQKQLIIGQRIMILDCGGGTVDVTVSELVDINPPKLKEILPASGDAWGGTIVDAQFRKFANSLIAQGQSTSSSSNVSNNDDDDSSTTTVATPKGQPSHHTENTISDAAALSACMDAWETAKCSWDPADSNRDRIVVTGLAPVCDFVGGAEEMSRRVTLYNEQQGLTGNDAIVYRPRSFSLVLPSKVVRSLFEHCVDPICNHMQKLLIEAAEGGRSVGFVFLVGGFAESVYLQRAVREALETENGPAAHLIVPGKPVQCVNRGAAVWGLYPKAFISSRVAKHTYAVLLNETYRPAVHDPVPHPSYFFINDSGTQVRNILVPLVQRNDDVAVDHSVTRNVVPSQDSQTDISFRIFRLDRRIGEVNDSSKRTYLLDDVVLSELPNRMKQLHVSNTSPAAAINVNIGSRGSRLDREASLQIFFGRSEIGVVASSRTTGETKRATITWDGSGTLAATGSK